jgi:hypothetical protein
MYKINCKVSSTDKWKYLNDTWLLLKSAVHKFKKQGESKSNSLAFNTQLRYCCYIIYAFIYILILRCFKFE